MRIIFEMIRKNTSLQVLDISCHNLLRSDPSLQDMSLSMNSALQELNLEGNDIHHEEAKGLMSSTSLKKLFLGRGNIKGIVGAMGKALEENHSLEELSLTGGPEITEDDAIAMGAALKVNTSLLVLNLNWCRHGEGSIQHIADGLKQNSTLKVIGIATFEPERARSAITEVIPDNHSLHTLDMSGNMFDADATSALETAMEKNSSIVSFGSSLCSDDPYGDEHDDGEDMDEYVWVHNAEKLDALLERNQKLKGSSRAVKAARHA